jgi:hypothetical protein
MIECAAQNMHLDQLVIQQGRQQQSKGMYGGQYARALNGLCCVYTCTIV